MAFTTPNQLGTFTVRCAELCGIWHGAMYNSGQVVDARPVRAWAKTTEKRLAANTKLLPPFAYTYIPDANGADGGYYPDNVDPYTKVETYGATPKDQRERLVTRFRSSDDTGDVDDAHPSAPTQATEPMAIDTTDAGAATTSRTSSTTPGEAPVPPPGLRQRSGWLRPHVLWAIVGAVVGLPRSATGWATSSPAAMRRSRTPARTTWPSCLGLVVRGGRLAGRHRRPQLPAGQAPRHASPPPAVPEQQLGPLLPDDRRPQGGRAAVHGRGAPVPVHRRPAGHGHPHRAAQPDQPRLRARDLHRHGRRARHDHDDDGLVGRGRARSATGWSRS